MRFTSTEKKDRYSYYQTAGAGGAIASWVAVGAMMSLSLIPNMANGYAAIPANIHFNATMAQKISVPEIEVQLNDDQQLVVVPKLSLLMRVEEISKFRANWDGDGAMAPNATAIMNARNLVLQLEDKDARMLLDGDVYASSYGSVVMDFETGRGLVSVEIGDRTMGFFTDFAEGENYAAEGIAVGGSKVPEVLQKYLD